jgi:tRNA-Thr(GGU) m(6)t(6)A37 methyltransferase TsaA
VPSLSLKQVGIVQNAITTPQDTGWGDVISHVIVEPEYAGMLTGLDAFSHVVIVYWMHRTVGGETWATQENLPATRRPRDRSDMPLVGLFAQRARHRPNPIGVTVCRCLNVSETDLTVAGLDAIDGTLVLDIKPHVPAFDVAEHPSTPLWMRTILANYFSYSTSDSPHTPCRTHSVVTPTESVFRDTMQDSPRQSDPNCVAQNATSLTEGHGVQHESPHERSTGSFFVRPLRAHDVANMHHLWQQAGLPFRPHGRDAPERLVDEIVRVPDLFLGAFDAVRSDELVGIVIATSDGRKGWINRLAVDPRWRGKGIATALIGEAERALVRRGLLLVAALIEPDNLPSLSLFRKLGYVLTDVKYVRKSQER